MQQNATDSQTARPLTSKQLRAVKALLSGESVTSVAREAKVDRTTIYRWLKEDFEFQTALNRGKKLLREDVETRLLVASTKAVDNVSQAIENGDVRTSLALLKGLGSLSGKEAVVGGVDPERMREEAEIAERQREAAYERRRLLSRELLGGI